MGGALRYNFGVDERTSTLIDLALAEDIGPGDVTSSYFVPEHREARGLILSKSAGVVAGVEVAEEVFKRVDDETLFKVLLESGNQVSLGAYVIEVRGKARSLLTAERVALNFLQRLSGVATKTRQFVDSQAGSMSNLIISQLRSNQIMSSRALGWIHIKFDYFSNKNQPHNDLQSSRLDSCQI